MSLPVALSLATPTCRMASPCVPHNAASRPPSYHRHHRRFSVIAAADRGGAVLDRPGFLTGDRSSAPQTDAGDGASQGDRGRSTGGGNWRVLLLDSPSHTKERVVNGLGTVVGLDASHAENIFETSRQLGQALVASTLLERAEFYQQELYRRGLRTTVEPDTSTL